MSVQEIALRLARSDRPTCPPYDLDHPVYLPRHQETKTNHVQEREQGARTPGLGRIVGIGIGYCPSTARPHQDEITTRSDCWRHRYWYQRKRAVRGIRLISSRSAVLIFTLLNREIIPTVRLVVQEEGWRGLWKGTVPTLAR